MDEVALPLVVGRGALVGLMAGIVMGLIWAYWVDKAEFNEDRIAMFFASFVLGSLLLAFVVHLPVWWAVAVGGSLAALVLGFALLRLAPLHHYYGFNQRYLGAVFVVAGVIGYVVAAWFASGAGSWWSRTMIVGLMVAVVTAAVRLEDRVQGWHRARGFGLLGVPLVALQIPAHSLVWADIWRSGEQGPAIRLHYRRGRIEDPSFSEVQVWIRPAAIATPAAACAEPYPYGRGSEGACQQIPGGYWVRRGTPRDLVQIALFARQGEALIQIESHLIESRRPPLPDLLTAVATIRPVSATFLADMAGVGRLSRS